MTRQILPPAAAEQHVAVLGKNGSGKTFAVKAVHVEPLLAAGKLVAIVDPTSAWWGLRTSADGRGPGFKVLVLGGDHGDLPLPANGGAAVARLIVEQRVPVVMDTGNLAVGERTRWMIEFAGAIYRLNRTPLYLIIDEAHVFAPQGGGGRMDPDVGKMLHAVNQLASGGRSRGIRLTMITQRPQKLHKDALTTADTLIAMRVLAPHDREAVKAWIDGCGDPAQGRQVLDSLAQLQRGEGWVWYPEGGHLQRTRFPAIRTFDSSATPTEGGAVKEPKGAAEIDLTEIRATLAEQLREAEANDPRRLHAEISRLKADAAKKPAGTPALDRQALADAEQHGYERARDEWINWTASILTDVEIKAEAIAHSTRALTVWLENVKETGQSMYGQKKPSATIPRRPAPSPAPASAAPRPREALKRAPRGQNGAEADIGGGAKRRVMIALAQNPAGLAGRKLSILADVRRGGSTWRAVMAALRRDQHVEDDGEHFRLTPAGTGALGNYAPLPTGTALREHWRSKMGNATRLAVFDTILSAYPDPIRAESVAQQSGVELGGSTWRAHMAYLRGLELVTGRSSLQASEDLFA